MIQYKVIRKSSTNEYIVRKYVNGKPDLNADYYTDNKKDAEDTQKHLTTNISKLEIVENLKIYLKNLPLKEKDIIWEWLDGNQDAIDELIECVGKK